MSTTTTLRRGSKGKEVEKLQSALQEQGFSVGDSGVDGSYGPDTEAAVTQYQKSLGLDADGIAGSRTLSRLYGTEADTDTTGTLLSRDALEAYLNREDFSFDLNADALYQQYKNDYVNQGRLAMEDTMGQAAALTGGYGSTYAQRVGQQTYQSYLEKLSQAAPELEARAYERYQDQGDDLYDRYKVLAGEEDRAYSRQRDALEDQWRQEELEYERQRDAVSDARWQKEFDNSVRSYLQEQDPDAQEGVTGSSGNTGLLSTQLQQGSTLDEEGTQLHYDNGQVTTGNIMTMERILGVKPDGLWSSEDVHATSGMTADQAWAAYQRGRLSYRYTTTVKDKPQTETRVDPGNIRVMERILGRPEDGVWDEEDQKAAGGVTAQQAWQRYQRGNLQYW